MVMTRGDLKLLRERLQADRLELIADIEARQRQIDEDGPVEPVQARGASRDLQDNKQRQRAVDDSGGGYDASTSGEAFFNSEREAMIDAGAELIADIRREADERVRELRERIAGLEGKMEMLLTLLGGNNGAAKAISRDARKLLKAPPP